MLQPSSAAVFYIKLAKGCLILPSSVTDFDERLYTIVGKTGYTLIRLAKTCLCISTQCDSVHTILGKTSYALYLANESSPSCVFTYCDSCANI